jgi:SAM-dependent methyltransferase
MQTQIETAKKATKGPVCILCGRDETVVVRTGIREDPTKLVYRCLVCRLQFLDSGIKDLRSYYADEYREKHDVTPGARTTPEDRFRQMRLSMEYPARKFMESVPLGGSVLEIGCSSGYFMDALQDNYQVYGNEWNPEDAAYVRDVGGLPCEEGGLPDIYPGKTFNAIVALQVLEHQPDPLAWLRQVKERLIGGGYLYLEVPNANDALLTVYGTEAYKDHYYRKPHITYWEVETLTYTLGSLGFEAKVSTRQRYGLLNHANWWLGGGPMDYIEGTEFLQPVPEDHPAAPIFNRGISKLDKEYRVMLEALRAADCIVAVAKRREI